ncbi:MAG: serine hydrolase domain-containing protein, partial [Phenylobacterium sp.]|nr:serine hydrolase domain-containing protein [Phenylobacterium sp.]
LTVAPRKTSILRLVLAFGAALLAAVAGPAAAQAASETEKRQGKRLAGIASAVDRQIAEGLIPGAVVYVSERGRPSYFTAQGLQNLETREPIRTDNIFRYFSMSKPLTCAAVMTLYDDGLINLDDPVKKYLPEFATMTVRTPAGVVPADRDMTIRHLMTHTSGLTYEVMQSLAASDYRDADVFAIRNRQQEDLEHHVKRLAQLPLTAQPGTAWNYGESMGVLGRIVEVVSGQSYRGYLKARILEPLEMKDTDFFVPPEKADRLAQLYIKGAGKPLVNLQDAAQYGGSYLTRPKLEYGGAGLVGTPADYMNFAQMMLDKGSFGDRRILSEKSVQLMTTNALPAALGDQPLEGRPRGVGFGYCGFVVVARDGDSPPGNVGEYGWNGWASTTFWIDPQRHLAGLIFTQVIPEVLGTSTLGPEVRAAIY